MSDEKLKLNFWLMDNRRKAFADYLSAVVASDGLYLSGIVLISQLKFFGKLTTLFNCGFYVPPLEKLNFNIYRATNKALNNIYIIDKQQNTKNAQLFDIKTYLKMLSDAIDKFMNKNNLSYTDFNTDDFFMGKVVKSKEEMLELFIENENLFFNRIKNKLMPIIKELANQNVQQQIKVQRQLGLQNLEKAKKCFDNFQRVVFIDIEATGLYNHEDSEILQVSIVDKSGKNILDQLVKPAISAIPKNDKHKITDAMVMDKPFISDVWHKIHSTLKSQDYIFAYNIESDFQYLAQAADNNVLPFELSQDNWIDVAELSKDLYGPLRWNCNDDKWYFLTPKLSDIYSKITNKDFSSLAHNAIEDAKATLKVFKMFADKLNNPSSCYQGKEKHAINSKIDKNNKKSSLKNNVLFQALCALNSKNPSK